VKFTVLAERKGDAALTAKCFGVRSVPSGVRRSRSGVAIVIGLPSFLRRSQAREAADILRSELRGEAGQNTAEHITLA
jgi:hypothetical protein